jgi:hypothetical protein
MDETTDEILGAMDRASPEILKIMILLLALEVKRLEASRIRVIEDLSPPDVSMAEMASRWATWGIGPKVYP